MAIVIERQKRGGGVMRLITALIIIGVVVGAGYYLFFAPTPAFDYIVPAPLQRTSELSKLDLDPSSVLDSSKFQSLKKIGSTPTTGQLGRPNPFLAQ